MAHSLLSIVTKTDGRGGAPRTMEGGAGGGYILIIARARAQSKLSARERSRALHTLALTCLSRNEFGGM